MNISEKLAGIPAVGKISDSFYKNKPTIYVVSGMIGTVVSVYLAWRAGKKTKPVIEEVKADLDEVHKLNPDGYEVKNEETGEVETVVSENALEKKDYSMELARVYIRAGYKLGKVFAPAVLTEAASLTAIGVGYGILNERHLATVQACNMYASTLARYRKSVRGEVGEEKEKELYYGTKEKEFEEPEVDKDGKPKLDKNGKPKIKRTKRQVLEEELSKHSMYARIFDPKNCQEFEYNSKTGEENVYYNNKSIKDRVVYLNKTMYYRPYHMWTMNEIYKEFGFKWRDFGQVTGYHCSGIDKATGKFIYDGDPEGIRVELFPVWYQDDETGEWVKTYIIDFNVPGSILGYYPKNDDLD